MNYKLGKLDAVRSPRLSDLSVYATGKLPSPPASVAAPSNVTWGMDDNDRLGCCTLSGVDHLIAAWNADLTETDTRPTDAEIQSTYFGLTGGQDTGLNEQTVLQTWQSTGLFGNKIVAFAPVAPQNIQELQQAIAFFGGSYIGISCPESAQQQFAADQQWTYVQGSPIEGGHCIILIGYDDSGVQAVSWGSLVSVSWPFLAHYMDEAWAIIGQEVVEHGNDGVGIDMQTLLADIASI